jgi:hypothetical protein
LEVNGVIVELPAFGIPLSRGFFELVTLTDELF